MSGSSPPATPNTEAPGHVPLVTVAPHQLQEEPLPQKSEQSPAATSAWIHCSPGSCSAHWGGGGTEAKRNPWAAKRDPPRAAACREQAPMQEELGCTSQAHRRGSRAHQQGGREAKVLGTPPVSSLFAASGTRCTHETEGCALVAAAGSCLPQRVR